MNESLEEVKARLEADLLALDLLVSDFERDARAREALDALAARAREIGGVALAAGGRLAVDALARALASRLEGGRRP